MQNKHISKGRMGSLKWMWALLMPMMRRHRALLLEPSTPWIFIFILLVNRVWPGHITWNLRFSFFICRYILHSRVLVSPEIMKIMCLKYNWCSENGSYQCNSELIGILFIAIKKPAQTSGLMSLKGPSVDLSFWQSCGQHHGTHASPPSWTFSVSFLLVGFILFQVLFMWWQKWPLAVLRW